MATAKALIRQKNGGRLRKKPGPPKIAIADQILFVLMNNRMRWFTIKLPASSGWGAIGIALHRRGCEVEKMDGEIRARWTHRKLTPELMIHVLQPVHPALIQQDKRGH